MGSHKNTELQNDWNTFGSDNFEFGLFDELKSDETATELEIKTDLKELLKLHKDQLLINGIMLY